MGWQTLKVGAGGFVRGVDVASDGTMVAFTDTDGAYLWNGSAWVQLVTSSKHAPPRVRRGKPHSRPGRLRHPDRQQQHKHHVHDV